MSNMKQTVNRRKAPRLRYRVTVHFSDISSDGHKTFEGQMLDVSSGGLAFRHYADKNCPHKGQQLLTRFSIPNSEANDCSMMEFTRTGRVLRVQQVNPTLRNIAVRFDEPLPVGRVFFDTIGLFLFNSKDRTRSTEDGTEIEKAQSLESMLEQRIEELEHELAELRQLRRQHTPPGRTTSS
jgi:hypothetical protein